MDIIEVNTNEQYDLVLKYAKKMGLDTPVSTILLYAFDYEKQEIIGLIGCEYVPIIEPLACNSGSVMDSLYKEALERIKYKRALINLDRVECYVNDKHLTLNMKSILKKKEFSFVEKINRFVKNLI